MSKEDRFKGIIDEKTLKILSTFAKNPDELYHINQLSEMTGIPLATTFRIINKLLQSKFIQIKKISKTKLYLFADNQKTRFWGLILR